MGLDTMKCYERITATFSKKEKFHKYWAKEARHKRVNTIVCHLYEVSFLTVQGLKHLLYVFEIFF